MTLDLYSFDTPSDPITFRATSDAVACFCTLWLGQGKAFFSRADGNEPNPKAIVFLMGATDAAFEAAVREAFGCPMQEFADRNVEDIVFCFHSFAYGRFSERKEYDLAVENIHDPEALREFLAANENRRSSLSEWVAAAWKSAASIRAARDKLKGDDA